MVDRLRDLALEVLVSNVRVLALGLVWGVGGASLSLWLSPHRRTDELGVLVAAPVISAYICSRLLGYVITRKQKQQPREATAKQLSFDRGAVESADVEARNSKHRMGRVTWFFTTALVIGAVLALASSAVATFAVIIYAAVGLSWAYLWTLYIVLLSVIAAIVFIAGAVSLSLASIAWEYRSTVLEELKKHLPRFGESGGSNILFGFLVRHVK